MFRSSLVVVGLRTRPWCCRNFGNESSFSREAGHLLSSIVGSVPGVVIPVHGSQVKILKTPSEFYESLVSEVRKARTRITLAALYLGTGEMEARLMDAVDKAAGANPNMSVRILMDHSRALRGAINSVTMAAPLVASHPGRVEVLLYEMPQLSRSPLLASLVPPPLNEVLGVSHLKAFAFDGNSIVSGANLSEIYFTNRQDRYLSVRGCSELSSFYHGLVDAIAPACWKVDASGKVLRPSIAAEAMIANIVDLFQGDSSPPVKGAGDEIAWDSIMGKTGEGVTLQENLEERYGPSALPAGQRSEGGGGGAGEKDTLLIPTLQHPSVGIRWDEEVTAALLRAGSAAGRSLGISSAYLNIPQAFLEALVPHLESATTEQPASGNGKRGHSCGQVQSLTCNGAVKVLTAGPISHGFAGARGLKSVVPLFYDLLTGDLLQRFAPGDAQNKDGREQVGGGLRVMEYHREHWSFHAKGLWIWGDGGWHGPLGTKERVLEVGTAGGTTSTTSKAEDCISTKDQEDTNINMGQSGGVCRNIEEAGSIHEGQQEHRNNQGPDTCLLSVCGSSNLGRRSTERDLESQLVVLTKNRGLSRDLGEEWTSLSKYAQEISLWRWQERQAGKEADGAQQGYRCHHEDTTEGDKSPNGPKMNAKGLKGGRGEGADPDGGVERRVLTSIARLILPIIKPFL